MSLPFLSAIYKDYLPVTTCLLITVASSESQVNVLKLNCHMFIMKVNTNIFSGSEGKRETLLMMWKAINKCWLWLLL